MSGDDLSGDEATKVEEDPVITGSAAFVAGLIPKKEIGADRFLAQHPTCDGRGVTIAIFDSGIDPGAAGLQVTPDGRPKVLDVLDCTGGGDVDTSTIVKADSEGFIAGASRARLQINKSWKNPSGEWRVGSKLVYQLFAPSLVSRLQKERKKRWTIVHREATTAELRRLTAFDLKNPKLTEASLRRERDELQTRYDLLLKHSSIYEDKGPVIDAVVWHDGEVWRVALDTQELEGDDSGTGKLADFTPLTNFRIERKYGTFSRLDACTFVTNVYDEGNVLSIVTDGSSHGTHVAGIAAAYHPEEPSLNGVAPGAQLVSCKTGDSRAEGTETGTGLTRALIAVLENKCDLINMSYGEPTTEPNYGRFIDLAEEVVNKHGVIFLSSAGNEGPSLSTVKAQACTSCIMSVGAYLSPEVASQVHSFVYPPTEGLQYATSSRGPSPDGALGVSLSAPGAAVAPVPKWTLQGRMLMKGTSMASPCACGGVALLLSSLKAKGRTISPHVVREALENTAKKLSDSPDEPLTTGRGLLQVDLAHEYLQHCKERPSVLYRVNLTRTGGSDAPLRGIYLRDVHDSRHASEWSVTVKPEFHEDADNINLLVPFEERLHLQSSHPKWLKCPEYLYLTSNGRNFNVVVDPTQLPEGVHYAEVVGTDLSAPWRGPSFRVPVTVTKPIELRTGTPTVSFAGLSFTNGHIERRFVVVPEGATWAELSLRVHGFKLRQFHLHTLQLSSKEKPNAWKATPVFTHPSSQTFLFGVRGGLTMELTLALTWHSGDWSEDPTEADLQLEFHGIQATEENVFINGNETVTRVDVKAPLAPEWLSPSATLTKVRVPYRPVEVRLEPLSAHRDKLSNGRQINALTLTYKFSLAERAEVGPCLSYLKMRLYDTEFESQLYMIFDANKMLLASGKGQRHIKGVRLSRGDYVLRLYIRHDKMSYLEKLKQIPLLVERKLEDRNQIKLSFYSNVHGPITGADPLKTKRLAPGEIQAVFIGVAGGDKLHNYSAVGTVLVGSLKWGKSPCPVSSGLSYVVPVPLKIEPKPVEKLPEEKKSISVRLEEEVRDFKIKLLSTLPLSTDEEQKEWDDLASSLLADHPKYLPLRIEMLQKLAGSQIKDDTQKAKVIQAADDVVSLIDRDALAKYFGVRREIDDPLAVQLKKEMEHQRDALADALYRKGLALSERNEQDAKTSPSHRLEDTPGERTGLKPNGGISAANGGNSAKETERARSPSRRLVPVPTSTEQETNKTREMEVAASVKEETSEAIIEGKEINPLVKQEADGDIHGNKKTPSSDQQEAPKEATFREGEDSYSEMPETTNEGILGQKEATSSAKHETTNGSFSEEKEAASSVQQETNGGLLEEKKAMSSGEQETSNGSILAEQEPPTAAKLETINGSISGEAETISPVKQEASNGAILGGKEAASPLKQDMKQEAKKDTNGAIVAEKDEFEENYLELRKWVDVGAVKFLMLTVKREMRAGRMGSAIKALNRLIKDESKPPQKHLFELRIKLVERAGWTHLAAYEKKWLSIRFPSTYPLF